MPDCEPLALEAWLALLEAWLALEADWFALLVADWLAVLDEGWFAEVVLCAMAAWLAEEPWACLSVLPAANAVLMDRASAVSASF